MLLAGVIADGDGAAADGSGTGLFSQLGCVRITLPGHVKGAVLWNALRAQSSISTNNSSRVQWLRDLLLHTLCKHIAAAAPA
jgi:hypothetical protein